MRNLLIALSVYFFLLSGAASQAATYKVDPQHTKITFKVRHMGISSVSGAFLAFDATFDFDPNSISSSQTRARITAKSIDTDNVKRDDHLRSADFLDVEKFPEIVFVSKEIAGVNQNRFKVLGDLSIHGITQPVVLEAEFGGMAKDPWGNERAAFSATATIDRKDFGITWNKVLEAGGLVVGESVKIGLEVEGIKEKK